mgnify:CR=1 FL=1
MGAALRRLLRGDRRGRALGHFLQHRRDDRCGHAGELQLRHHVVGDVEGLLAGLDGLEDVALGSPGGDHADDIFVRERRCGRSAALADERRGESASAHAIARLEPMR